MPQSATLDIVASGSPETTGQVLFVDFRNLLDNLTQCLREVERRVAGTAKMPLVVSKLEIGSARICLAPLATNDAEALGGIVIAEFKNTINRLESGGVIEPRPREKELLLFRKLVEPFQGNGKSLKVAGIKTTSRFLNNVDKLIRDSMPSHGSVKGRAERLNVHNCNEFTLYPPITGYSIICRFNDALFEKVRGAIKHNVTVHGRMHYMADGPFPERVEVESIDIHLPDDQLPPLASLRGLMPDATGSLTTLEFIRALSDE